MRLITPICLTVLLAAFFFQTAAQKKQYRLPKHVAKENFAPNKIVVKVKPGASLNPYASKGYNHLNRRVVNFLNKSPNSNHPLSNIFLIDRG